MRRWSKVWPLLAAGALLAPAAWELLLPWGLAGEPPATPKASAASSAKRDAKVEPADNSYCLVCHANYEDEKLTKVHVPAGVGCEKCHGESVKHSGDEDGLTPPDKMYAPADVTPMCLGCHEKPLLLKRDDHKEFFAANEPDETCNDCHGQHHRLKVRTRVWDKKTGKLVKDDGVRMMQKDSPATEGAVRKAK